MKNTLFALALFAATLSGQTPVGGGGGGGAPTIETKEFIAAICDNVAAIGGFAKPTANAPTAACVTGTNTNYGVLEFDATTGETVQERFRLNVLPSSIDVVVEWSTAATSGAVVWSLRAICIADTESLDTAFAGAQTFSADTADGTANRKNSVTLTAATITSCSAGDLYMFEFKRAPADGGDTLAVDADLISLTFVLN